MFTRTLLNKVKKDNKEKAQRSYFQYQLFQREYTFITQLNADQDCILSIKFKFQSHLDKSDLAY